MKKTIFRLLGVMLILAMVMSVPAFAVDNLHDHQWEDSGESTATCTEAGVQPQTCSICGSTRSKPVSATGHSWEDSGESTATCTEAGVQPQTCSVCGSTRNKPVSSTGVHSWVDSGESTATCTEAGEQPQTCSLCGSTRQKPVPAAGHTEEVIPGKAATSTETGLTEGVKCSVCGEILVVQEVIPALGSTGSPSPTTYTVTIPSVDNGTVTASPTSASKGTTVTLTVSLNDGYELSALTVTDASGNVLTLTDKGSDTYTFTMPASKVTVSATFKATAHDCPSEKFTDVDITQYYHEAVDWAVLNGVTYGNGASTFGVGETCNRADAMTFIWRAYGCPAPKVTANPFTDVSGTAYYYEAVLWAVENGITVGTSDTTFSPLEFCCREHIVTFLYRAAGSPAVSQSSGFTDVSDSAYYANAVTWASQNNITVGAGSTITFGPTQNCYREQIVTFLYRNLAE